MKTIKGKKSNQIKIFNWTLPDKIQMGLLPGYFFFVNKFRNNKIDVFNCLQLGFYSAK